MPIKHKKFDLKKVHFSDPHEKIIPAMTWWESSDKRVFIFVGAYYCRKARRTRVELREVGRNSGIYQDYSTFEQLVKEYKLIRIKELYD